MARLGRDELDGKTESHQAIPEGQVPRAMETGSLIGTAPPAACKPLLYLRKVIWVDTATGGKQRKRPYLGHLSKSAFADMKKRHKGKSLDSAISAWVADHDQ